MKNNDQVLLNLKKARSHIDKVISMLEEDAYCIDVIQQINAVMGYLSSARLKKLESHLNSCFAEGMHEHNTQENKQKLIEEVIKVIKVTK